jgi:hypothetical protein
MSASNNALSSDLIKGDLMHPRTAATLDELGQFDWFANVGRLDTDVADILPDWESAINSCGSLAWENLCLEAVDQYRERLSERAPEALNKWNDIVQSVKPATISLVRNKTTAVIAAKCPSQSLSRHCCMGHPASLHGSGICGHQPAGFLRESGLLVYEGALSLWVEGPVSRWRSAGHLLTADRTQ